MSYRRILSILLLLALLGGTVLWAGDTASFVDLGFSPDGKTYMFAQYGVQSRTLKPWADLFIVDVLKNNFVSGGRLSYLNDSPVVSGQNGSGALYSIIRQNAALAEKYRIDHCFQGQPLYIDLEAGSPGAPQTLPAAGGQPPIAFRDFENGADYRASLVSLVEGSGAALKSSFFINLERTAKDGTKKNYTVGTPQLKRPLVSSYRIKKVMTAPRDGSMIMVIEMKKQDGESLDIRYMVEALRL